MWQYFARLQKNQDGDTARRRLLAYGADARDEHELSNDRRGKHAERAPADGDRCRRSLPRQRQDAEAGDEEEPKRQREDEQTVGHGAGENGPTDLGVARDRREGGVERPGMHPRPLDPLSQSTHPPGGERNRCRTLGVAGGSRSGAVTVPADFSLDGAFSLGCPLLPRHRDAQALLGRDQVVGVLGVLAEVDLHPPDPCGFFPCKPAAFVGAAKGAIIRFMDPS